MYRHSSSFALVALVALAACSGGGGGDSGSTTPKTPTVPQSTYVTPTFVLSIPPRTSASGSRGPKYIASTTASVKIQVTSDSAGVPTGSLTATTTIAPGACSPSCTVSGPPTPPGTDSFLIDTYDSNTKALDAAQLNNITIVAGQANAQTVTLGGIPISATASFPVSIDGFAAGTQSQKTSVSIQATDADNNAINSGSVPYVDASGNPVTLTLSDPDTASHGSCLVASGSSACTGGAATSASFTNLNATASFAYDGLAENPVTLTISGSTLAANGSTVFQPTLNAPVFNTAQATPSGIASTTAAEVDLFATSSTGSTGSESFTESGWTNAPYGHALTEVVPSPAGCLTVNGQTLATALSQFATIAAGANSTTNGTPFTATATGTPTAGSCPATITDGLALNSTDAPATLTVTYTSFTLSGNAKHRSP